MHFAAGGYCSTFTRCVENSTGGETNFQAYRYLIVYRVLPRAKATSCALLL